MTESEKEYDLCKRIEDTSWEVRSTFPDWKFDLYMTGETPFLKRCELTSTRQLVQMLKREDALILEENPTTVYAEIRGRKFVFLITKDGVKAFKPTEFYIMEK